MGLLIFLVVLLILAIVFFVTFPIFKRKFVCKNYNALCNKKIKSISQKNQYKFLTNFDSNFDGENNVQIDSIIFGKKYIYILSNYYFNGDIKGTADNNSWILEKSDDSGCEYIDNISDELSRKNRVFSSKINTDSGLIIPIALVNNECEIKVNGINNNSTFVVHYSYLKKLIKKLESRDIADLDAVEVENQYEILANENR